MTNEQIHIIIQDEIGAEYPGDHRYYDKKCAYPSWPGGESGVTIGIGYDLGYNTKDQIRKDWGGKVNGNIMAFMLNSAGIRGAAAKKLITTNVKGFFIPYETAKQVFLDSSLPRFKTLAEKKFPGLGQLNEVTQAVIIGLVYNRGASLSGDRRVEMAALVPAVAAKNYEEISFQIDKMKRLWVNTTVSGLVARRENEAKMIKDSIS